MAARCARRIAVAAFGFAILAGCSTARPVTDGERACVSWVEEIQPLLAAQCAGCHSGSGAQGGYDVTGYLTALTDGKGAAVAQAGNAGSLLLRTLDPATADPTHAAFSSLLPQLTQWVVGCDVSYFRSAFHPGGILNPADGDFHGALIRASGWDLPLCAGCHGDDFAGGKSGASCLGCHKDGPTACTTCHAEPPTSGAHLAHAAGALARSFDCGECHVKPALYTDAGHLFAVDGSVIANPTLTFGALAGASFGAVPRAGAPSWDRAGDRCDNVYCHGGAFADSAATRRSPTWNGGPDQAACTTCHGSPPSDHQSDRCSECHGKVADATRAIVDRSRHVDGKISLGDESGTCSACHGGPSGPAPPRDLAGHVDASFVGVGAHQAHLLAPHRLSAPVACEACHLVPATLDSPGHLDGTTAVFPATIAAGGIAFTDGAKPTWDHASARCGDAYCHGGGVKLRGDAALAINRTPGWTLGEGEAQCGACHGVPPVDGAHDPTMRLDGCVKCHATTVDGGGTILVANGKSAHVNGVVDVTQ